MLGSGIARADVQSETTCYMYESQTTASKDILLVVRTYLDNDLKKEVGAFAQYNGSKEIIPLVFKKYVATDTDSPGLGNYEISRIEIKDKKVTGEYIFFHTGAGHTQGKYVIYKNAKTGKATLFMEIPDDNPSCKINK
jgi:hypothetical protein